jgi:hypothetical protein
MSSTKNSLKLIATLLALGATGVAQAHTGHRHRKPHGRPEPSIWSRPLAGHGGCGPLVRQEFVHCAMLGKVLLLS